MVNFKYLIFQPFKKQVIFKQKAAWSGGFLL